MASQWECISIQESYIKKISIFKEEYNKWLKTLSTLEKKAYSDYPLWAYYTNKEGSGIYRIFKFNMYNGIPIMNAISIKLREVEYISIPLWELRKIDKWDDAALMVISSCEFSNDIINPMGYKKFI